MKKTIVMLVCLLLLVMSLTACHSGGETSTPDSTAATTTVTSAAQTTITEATTVPTEAATAPTGQEAIVPTTSTATDPTTSIGTTAAKPTATATTTSKATTADWKKHYISKQILRDNTYQNGVDVTGQEERVAIGTWYHTDSTENTVWSVGQWGTFKSYTDRSGYLCLLRDRLDTPRHILSNGLNTLTYNDTRKSLTFTMNTYAYYGGKGHTDNRSWPSLILGQGIIDGETFFNLEDEEMPFYSPAADKIIVSLDVRMTEFSHKKLEGVNACQFLSFYYVRSLRDSGFIWFRVPIFDDRGYDPDETEITFLKDVGSGRYICRTPYAQVYKNTRPDGRRDFFNDETQSKVEPGEEWMHIEMDIKPYLEEMFEQTKRGSQYDVYRYTTAMKDLYFSGMNIGFEIHGSYDVSFEVMNHTVTTYIKK